MVWQDSRNLCGSSGVLLVGHRIGRERSCDIGTSKRIVLC